MASASGPGGVGRAWMITFVDLVSLLLAFFVMIFAMSGVRHDLWTSTVASLNRTEGPPISEPAERPAAPRNAPARMSEAATDLDYLDALLKATMAVEPLLAEVRIEARDGALVLVFAEETLFVPATDAPSPVARRTLIAIGGILRNIGNRVGVHAFGGGTAAGNGGEDVEWESALARAAAVADVLRSSGYDRTVRAYAFVEGREQHPAAEDRVARASLARRIEIAILAHADLP